MYKNLKKDIQASFGEISKIRHCTMLSDDILLATKKRVSESTLWRIFVDVEDNYRPHEYTLDILSVYLHYNDWRDYTDKQSELKSKMNPQLQLLDLCLKDHHIDTVVKFLKSLPDDLSYDYHETIQISGIIGNAILEDTQLRRKILPKLATFEQGRIYFSDMFVDEKNFDLYYKKSLNYYLKEKVNNPIKNSNDQLFALNLLYKHALFKNDAKNVRSYSKTLHSFQDDVYVKKEAIHVFPYYRYKNFLLVQKYLDQEISSVAFVSELIKLCDMYLNEYHHTFLFRKITAEYLLYFKFYSEAKYLLQIAKKEHTYSNCILEEIDELLSMIPEVEVDY